VPLPEKEGGPIAWLGKKMPASIGKKRGKGSLRRGGVLEPLGRCGSGLGGFFTKHATDQKKKGVFIFKRENRFRRRCKWGKGGHNP